MDKKANQIAARIRALILLLASEGEKHGYELEWIDPKNGVKFHWSFEQEEEDYQEPEPVPAGYNEVDLNDLTVAELKSLAAINDVKVSRKANKAKLVNALVEASVEHGGLYAW